MHLDAYLSATPMKALNLGNPGGGKTTSLFSLLRAGYRLAIVDLDGKLRSLAYLGARAVPDLMRSHVDVVHLSERYETSASGMLAYAAAPQVYSALNRLLDWWKSDTLDLGPVRSWNDGIVLVIDGLSPLSTATLGTVRYGNNRRPDQGDGFGRDYGSAQSMLEILFERLRSNTETPCHVVINGHLQLSSSNELGQKFMANLVGRQLAPRLGGFFDLITACEAMIYAPGKVLHVVRTQPTGTLDLKVPAGTDVPPVLPNDTALAYLFEVCRGKAGPGGSILPAVQRIHQSLPVSLEQLAMLPSTIGAAGGGSFVPAATGPQQGSGSGRSGPISF